MNDTLADVFKGQNRFVMIGWLLLVFLPTWQYTPSIIMIVVLTICAFYSYFILFGQSYDESARKPHYKDFGSLAGVLKLFSNARVVLAGWLHYLAFDLLIGLFIVMDSQQHAISHFMILPVLFLSLMIGPAGLLCYFILRVFYTGNLFDLTWFIPS